MSETNYAVAPGAYLEEWSAENEVSHRHIASSLGLTPGGLMLFFMGCRELTDEFAGRLEVLTGLPADSWRRYETAYRADLARLGGDDA